MDNPSRQVRRAAARQAQQGPQSSFEKLRQSTFFWGCAGAAIAIVITVIATMRQDIRWLLAFAWPFVAFAAWEFARTATKSRPIIILSVALSGVIAAIGLGALYLWLSPEPSELLGTGGSVQLTSLPARLMPDGSFKAPVAIVSKGDEEILNYTYHFQQQVTNRILDLKEEHEAFEEAAKQFFADAKTAKGQEIKGIANLLKPNDIAVIMQPVISLDKDTMEKILHQQQFLYDFVVVRYTDKDSVKKNRYYIAEHCAREDALGSSIPCRLHNFMKADEP
jgi:hypothetical protein